MLASALALYAIGARFGQDALRRLLGPRLDRVRARIARQGVLAVAAVRVVPVAPFTFVNLALGASAIKLVDYVAGTLLGMLPGLIVMSALGHRIVAIISNPSIEEVSLLALAVAGWVAVSLAVQALVSRLWSRGILSATVRLMTWNIHGAVGRNPRFDLARVVELILRHAPDIVALQEIDSRRQAAAAIPLTSFSRRSAATASAPRPSPPPTANTGRRCSAAGRCNRARFSDISYQEREPRRAIRTEIQTPAGPLRVIATHLGLSLGERKQPSRGAAWPDRAIPRPPPSCLGDFNDWFWAGSVRKVLARALPGRTPPSNVSLDLSAAPPRPHLLPAARGAGAQLHRSFGARDLGSPAGDRGRAGG